MCANCFTKRGRKVLSGRMSSRSCSTSTWPSVSAPEPIPIVGMVDPARDGRGHRRGHALEHDRRSSPPPAGRPPSRTAPWPAATGGPGPCGRRAWSPSAVSGRCGPSPGCRRPISAAARCTDWPPPSSLTASAPRLLDESAAVAHGVLVGHLVGHERQVADHERVLARPRDGPGQDQAARPSSRRTVETASWPSTVFAAESPTSTMSTPGLVDDPAAGVVVGRDHHDRGAGQLQLVQVGQGDLHDASSRAMLSIRRVAPNRAAPITIAPGPRLDRLEACRGRRRPGSRARPRHSAGSRATRARWSDGAAARSSGVR